MPMLMLICRVSADEDIPRQPDTVPSLLFCFFSKNERSIYAQRPVFAPFSTRIRKLREATFGVRIGFHKDESSGFGQTVGT